MAAKKKTGRSRECHQGDEQNVPAIVADPHAEVQSGNESEAGGDGSGPEIYVLVRQVRLVKQLLSAAPAWFAEQGIHVPTQGNDAESRHFSQPLPKWSDIVDLLRCRVTDGDVEAIQLLGLAASESVATLGVFDASLTESMPNLVAALDNGSTQVQSAALSALTNWGSQATMKAVIKTASMLNHADEQVQVAAARALQTFPAVKVAQSITLIAEVIDRTGPIELRVALCQVAAALGARALPALPAIIRAATTATDSALISTALSSLINIDPGGEQVNAAMPSDLIRERLVERLMDSGDNGQIVAERLLRAAPHNHRCVVQLRGREEKPLVNGVEVDVLSSIEYDVIEAMIKAGPKGLNDSDLKEIATTARLKINNLERQDHWKDAIVEGRGACRPGERRRRVKGDRYRLVFV